MSRMVCLDFDGVLCSESLWEDPEEMEGSPVEGAVKFVEDLIENGYAVAVFSTRSGHKRGLAAMWQWLKANGFPVGSMQLPTSKPPAFLTIDDRAMLFKGKFPTLKQVESFKAWWVDDED